GVVRRIPIGGGASELDPFRSIPATRQSGGFAFGPWESSNGDGRVNALALDGNGRRLPFGAARSTNAVHWSLFLAGASLVVDVYLDQQAQGDSLFSARALGTESSTNRGPVVEAPWRGTDTVLAQPSLDGKHAVFAIWPEALSEPRAAYLGSDGS